MGGPHRVEAAAEASSSRVYCGRLWMTPGGQLLRSEPPVQCLDHLAPHDARIAHTARWVASTDTFHQATLLHWAGEALHVQALLALARDGEVDVVLGPLYPALGPPQDQSLLEALTAYPDDVVLVTEAEPIDEPGPRVIYASPSFTAMTGYPVHEVLGRSPRLLQGPGSERSALDEVRRGLRSWRPSRVEVTNYRRDGVPFVVDLQIQPVKDATGWYTHWIAIQRDVTDRRLAEIQSLRMERLEAVVRLAGGVAHDFNNLLVGLIGNLALARRSAAPGTELDELLADAEGIALRARDLTRLLHAFAHDQGSGVEARVRLDFLELARGAVETALAGRGLAIEISAAAPSPVWVRGEPARLRRALGRLALEVAAGLEGASRLQLALRGVVGRETSPQLAPGQSYALLEIAVPDRAARGGDPKRVGIQPGAGSRPSLGIGLAVSGAVMSLQGGAVWPLSAAHGVAVALPVDDDERRLSP